MALVAVSNVQNVTVTITQTEATLVYDGFGECVSVRMRPVDGDWGSPFTSASLTGFVIDGLFDRGVRYEFEITTGMMGCTEFTPPDYYAATVSAAVEPPTNLRFIEQGATYQKIAWDGDTEGLYDVSWISDQDDHETMQVKGTVATLFNIDPCMNYSIYVTARRGDYFEPTPDLSYLDRFAGCVKYPPVAIGTSTKPVTSTTPPTSTTNTTTTFLP